MNAQIVEARLRRFLLILAGFMCLGAVAELLLIGHTESLTQWIPFALCSLGLVAILLVLLRPQRATLLALRGVMSLSALGSLLGVYEHLQGNVAFAQEVHPDAPASQIFFDALRGGNPLLAPGILALAAIVAIAATYYHPALGGRDDL